MNKITKEYLCSKFDYNPDTGVLKKRKYARKGKTGKYDKDGYIIIGLDHKEYKAHRLIWIMTYGDIPEKMEIDHINGIKDDNRLSNLRLVTHKENSRNRPISSQNTSGVAGVSWCKSRNRWRARIKVDYKDIHLGFFVEFHEAVNARKNAEVLYGFHENHGRSL